MLEEMVEKQNNVKVEYTDDFPPEVFETIKESVAFVVPILPRWCSHLYVEWYGDDSCELMIKISVKNRWASLQFHANFFNRTDYDRKIGLIHEVIHLYLEPMADVFNAVVDEEDKPINKLWINAVERATQDLALAWNEHLSMNEVNTATSEPETLEPETKVGEEQPPRDYTHSVRGGGGDEDND